MQKILNITVGSLATNCWIYPLDKQPGSCVVIDPGEEGSRIIAFLNRLKLVPAHIVLTHGHFDHIGAVPALKAEYQCETAIHAADAEFFDMPPPDRTLAEGDSIGPFTVLHLSGHTPGSIGLWDREAQILFSGDTLFCDGYGRTDFPGGSEEQLYASLKRLFAMDAGIQVYPGHGPATSIGREMVS